jgi:hypothetical protein
MHILRPGSSQELILDRCPDEIMTRLPVWQLCVSYGKSPYIHGRKRRKINGSLTSEKDFVA